MKKQQKPEFDYLQSLVREQVQEVRNFGPIAYEIIDVLKPPAGPVNVESLVRRVVELDKLILQVELDGINLFMQPALRSAVVKTLARGDQLMALERDTERKIGQQGEWLHVLDINGDKGYVLAQFVSRVETSRDPGERIDRTMHTLEYFSKMEIVQIDKQGNQFDVRLTQKGKYLADFLVQPDEGNLKNEQFIG
jgi:hypothetical protein